MNITCPHCAEPIALLTAAEVAERLGLSPVTVRERARERHIGLEVDARTRLYTEADVVALAELRPRGRPRNVATGRG